MRRLVTALTAASLAFGLAAAAPGADDRVPSSTRETFELTPGESVTVLSATPGGVYGGFSATAGTMPECDESTPGVMYCEGFLVGISGGEVVVSDDDGSESLRSELLVTLTPDAPTGDYDIRLYESDESGTIGAEVNSGAEWFYDHTLDCGCADPDVEEMKQRVNTTVEEPVKWYVVTVTYWAAVGGYSMDIAVE